jgi:hypothetical protein
VERVFPAAVGRIESCRLLQILRIERSVGGDIDGLIGNFNLAPVRDRFIVARALVPFF